MGLDYGDRKIGVAVSDSLYMTAQGVTTIYRSRDEFPELGRLIDQYEVTEIILGYPRNMDGSAGPRAQKTASFADQLREEFHLPVYLWDERLSTVAAERFLLEGDVSRKKRKLVIDKLAAVLILQPFLDRRAREKEREKERSEQESFDKDEGQEYNVSNLKKR
jgi:putative Holliday junction resolvase